MGQLVAAARRLMAEQDPDGVMRARQEARLAAHRSRVGLAGGGHAHTVDEDGYCDECGWTEGDDE
jgi:hypothetical protein